MNDAENNMAELYLARVKSAMFGMDKTARDGIISELRSHIEDSLADAPTQEAKEKVFAELEEPRKLARSYKAIYGYSRTFNTLLIIDCIAMAVLSVPLLYPVNWDILASLFFAFAVAETGLVGYLGGDKVGLAAGVSTATARILTFIIIYILSDNYVLRADDGLAFVIVSMVLVIVGYGMGKAKEKWPGSDELADL
ncbi:MAG: hypothetical protein KAS67_01490 [Thermoplasmata archaeon]|nr:hypothetical protein [Thermoplasmata archaeon]